MSAVLRWTGVLKLVSLYRYIAFNIPRVTTLAGVFLLLGVAAIRLRELLGSFPAPSYLRVYFGLVVAAALLATCMIATIPWRLITRVGWALGSLVAAGSLAMYLASRTIGLPELPWLVGRWDYPLGTLGMGLSAAFLALHFTIATGTNVASPDRQPWHD